MECGDCAAGISSCWQQRGDRSNSSAAAYFSTPTSWSSSRRPMRAAGSIALRGISAIVASRRAGCNGPFAPCWMGSTKFSITILLGGIIQVPGIFFCVLTTIPELLDSCVDLDSRRAIRRLRRGLPGRKDISHSHGPYRRYRAKRLPGLGSLLRRDYTSALKRRDYMKWYEE